GQFARLCEVAGCPEFAEDVRFATNPARVRNRAVLVPLLAERIAAKPMAFWTESLEAAGVPCGPINDLGQVFEDPQVRHRNMRVELPHPTAGSVSLVGSPIKLSRTPVVYSSAPPTLGQQTAQVLTDVLGLDAAQIAALRASSVI
ncbi:MAG: CoA transferase, partial [Burkholderiales bacterium]|nr:CoA transferase [Burkholderiales bacterium]